MRDTSCCKKYIRSHKISHAIYKNYWNTGKSYGPFLYYSNIVRIVSWNSLFHLRKNTYGYVQPLTATQPSIFTWPKASTTTSSTTSTVTIQSASRLWIPVSTSTPTTTTTSNIFQDKENLLEAIVFKTQNKRIEDKCK